MRAPNFHGNIVVSNLPEGFTAVELAALFDDFGLVLGAEMDRQRGRQGSIMLAPEPAVAKAIEALDGQSLAERKLKVARAPAVVKRPKAAARPQPAAAPRPQPAAAPAPERIAEAIRRFRTVSSDDAVLAAPQAPAPARPVVVEYRKTRRFEIPPRAPMAARG
jgi:RNA recognition motif. (a.k.a. RRM, RBD, or RNP domain)